MKTNVWSIAFVKDPTNVSKAAQWFFPSYLPTSSWFQPWISRSKRGGNEKLGWQGRKLTACLVAWGHHLSEQSKNQPCPRALFSVVRGILKFTGWIKFPKHPLSHSPSSCFSTVQLFETLWTVARQAPLSMGFSRQEYWSGLPCPPENLLNPGIESTSLMSPARAGKFFVTSTTWEALPSHTHTLFIYFSPRAMSDKTC